MKVIALHGPENTEELPSKGERRGAANPRTATRSTLEGKSITALHNPRVEPSLPHPPDDAAAFPGPESGSAKTASSRSLRFDGHAVRAASTQALALRGKTKQNTKSMHK